MVPAKVVAIDTYRARSDRTRASPLFFGHRLDDDLERLRLQRPIAYRAVVQLTRALASEIPTRKR